MPRNTREMLIRKVDQAINDLERSLEKLQVMAKTYEPTHPKHAKFIEVNASMILQVKEQITDFKNKFM